jgi:hypothetical protein
VADRALPSLQPARAKKYSAVQEQFTAAAVGGKPRGYGVYFLFTTVPPHSPRVAKVVENMLSQTLVPDGVILTVPERFQRFNSTVSAPKVSERSRTWPDNFLRWNTVDLDYGPLTKYMGHNLVKDGDIVIIGDDDVDYAKTFIEDFVGGVVSSSHPAALLGGVDEEFNGVMGTNGVGLRAGSLRGLPTNHPESCFFADDVIVTHFLDTKGIRKIEMETREDDDVDTAYQHDATSVNAFHNAFKSGRQGIDVNLNCMRDLQSEWPIPGAEPQAPKGTAAAAVAAGASHKRDLQQCSFKILMLDDRPIPSRWADIKGKYTRHVPAATVVLNRAYAHRHGYDFEYVQVPESDQNEVWGKVMYIAEQLNALASRDECTWLLFLDSDAFVHEPNVDLPSFISNLTTRYNIRQDIGLVVAQEQYIENDFPLHEPWLNGGVFLVQANPNSLRLFNMWLCAGKHGRPEWQTDFPGEQGVLTELVTGWVSPEFGGTNGYDAPKRNNFDKLVAVVNMTEMNSPWGHFVEHIWGGVGVKRRRTDYAAALAEIGGIDPDAFQGLLSKARGHAIHWQPPSQLRCGDHLAFNEF